MERELARKPSKERERILLEGERKDIRHIRILTIMWVTGVGFALFLSIFMLWKYIPLEISLLLFTIYIICTLLAIRYLFQKREMEKKIERGEYVKIEKEKELGERIKLLWKIMTIAGLLVIAFTFATNMDFTFEENLLTKFPQFSCPPEVDYILGFGRLEQEILCTRLGDSLPIVKYDYVFYLLGGLVAFCGTLIYIRYESWEKGKKRRIISIHVKHKL